MSTGSCCGAEEIEQQSEGDKSGVHDVQGLRSLKRSVEISAYGVRRN